ncbi:hypothetical protein ABFG93_14550 [Pseudalkalibacillus hwajinpoensis]|uniref:hypothetical protein n=1 Tax=Guptibacillus hwajinpoensis TaxID=208199 RepID=UPI00325AB05B
MVEKTCTECNKPSYSSNYQGEWIFPYCGIDMTKVPVNNEAYIDQVASNKE